MKARLVNVEPGKAFSIALDLDGEDSMQRNLSVCMEGDRWLEAMMHVSVAHRAGVDQLDPSALVDRIRRTLTHAMEQSVMATQGDRAFIRRSAVAAAIQQIGQFVAFGRISSLKLEWAGDDDDPALTFCVEQAPVPERIDLDLSIVDRADKLA